MLPSSLPFTREGGWGSGQEACVGAPGDATALATGNRAGSLTGDGAGNRGGAGGVARLGGNYRTGGGDLGTAEDGRA